MSKNLDSQKCETDEYKAKKYKPAKRPALKTVEVKK